MAEITLFQKLIFQNLHVSEFTSGRNYISPKTYFRDIIHTLAISFRKIKLHLVKFTLREIY